MHLLFIYLCENLWYTIKIGCKWVRKCKSMNILTTIILVFSILGLADKLLGNKLGLGAEFEKGFSLFVQMTFSMVEMLVISPAVGVWLNPFFNWFYSVFNVDPSIIPASLFANDCWKNYFRNCSGGISVVNL